MAAAAASRRHRVPPAMLLSKPMLVPMLLLLLGFIALASAGSVAKRPWKNSTSCDPDTHFVCRSDPKICIALSRVRDGSADCPDASDEACHRGEFRCLSNYFCIPERRVRDGWEDCPDGSDEICQKNEHRCRCGFPRCISVERVGDGVRDCLDGSDEDKEKGKAYKCPSDSSLQDLMAVERRRRSDSERRRRARHSGLMTYTVGLDHQAEAAEVSVALIEPTGALATLTRTEVNAEQTTLHTTEIRREYVEGTYSQILSTHSTVLELAPSLNEVEDSAQQEGRRQRPHTTHGVQSFGSLSSGKVFQTAVNELSSAVTTEVQPTRTTQASLLSALPGTKSTTVVGLNIKSGQISELSEEKDSEVPVITVTGTEGLLVQGTGSDHVTYKVFTGTYVNTEGHDAKTYMFFFGNRQLPVDATPSLPQEATRSEQFDIRSGNQKGVVLDISHKIGILLPSQTVSSISPTEAPRSDYLIFGSGSAHGGESMTGMLIEGSEPITIEGMTRSRMSTASTMHVTLSSMPAQSRREKTSSTTHKKATPTLYRHGKKFEPTATGRRIAPMDGATIITDKFFLPQHLGLYTTSPVSDTSRTADEFLEEVDHDYDTPPVREEEEDPVVMVRMRHPVNNFNIEAFRPELLTPTPVKDIRPTRTVGSNQDEYTDDAGDIFATDAFSDQDNEQNKSTKKNRVTLFGFVDFTTTISGTEVVFQPAATGTSFDFGNTRRPHEEDIYNPFNIPTRKPQTTSSSAKRKDSTYGTETREFVSKLSMLTSTFKGGVEMLSTMYTSTIPMLVKSRLPKYDDAELEGHVHSLAAEPNIGSSEYTEDYLYDSHVYENLVRSSSFSPEGLVTPNFLSSYLFPASKDQDVDSPISRTQERSSSVQPSETVMVSMIEGSKTEKYPVTPTRPALSTPTPKRKKTYKTGLVSSITGTDINGDMTTEWTTLIIGTVIGGRYAHVIQSTSSIFYTQSKTEMMEEVTTPKAPPPAPGLVLPSDIQIEGVSDRAVTEQELEEGTEAPAPATEETPQAESGEGAHDSLDVYSITSNFAVPLINQSRVVEDSYETALSGQEQPSVVELSDDLHVSTLVPSIEPSYTSPSSTSDVAVLTDGFILPSTQESTKEYDYDQPPTASASPEEDKPKIITMGFILPGADPASEFEDDLVHTDEVRLLTDGFVLPGQDLPSQLGNDQTQSTLQGRIIDTVVPPQQEAATVTSYPITHYSTFTYYTTLPGPSDSIVSSREVTTSQVFENSEEYEEARKHGFDTIAPEKSMLPLDPSQPATVMTTYTYQSTYTLDGSTLVSVSEKTMSDLLAPSEENVDSEKISPTATQVYLETSPGYDAASGTGQEDPHAQNPSESSETDDTTSSKATPPLEAAPTTYFTTYTYLTTLFKDGTSSVTSSLETVSNILYGSSSGSEDPVHDSLKKISPTSMVPVTTYYTTYTYFTTLLKDGTSTVTSREEIVSNTVRGSDATMTTQPSDLIEPTKTDLLSTVYTTYTYYTTFVRGGSTTIRNRTQVVSKVKTISQPSTTELITAPVVSTYYTTYTYFTTVNRGGTKSVKSRESVKTNVVTKYPKTAADQSTPVPSIITTYTTILSPVTVYRDGTPRVSFISKTSAITKTLTHSSTPTSEEAAESIIEATPTAGMHTMFTTYTYYTTFYEDGTPVISSREETVTNMISKPTGTPHLEETKRNLESSTIVRTYYTTYTYFTTFETDESPTVSSREEIVTNYVTMTPHDIITGVSPTSVSPEAQPTEASMTEETPPLLSSLPEGIDLRELLRNVPVTHYTTYTYYTTLYTDGSSVLSSRTEVVSNVVGPTAATAPTLPAGLEVDHSDLQSSVESTESTHISSSKAAESSSSEARSDTESIVADLAAQQSATPAPSPSFTPKLDSSFQKASSRFQKSPLKFRLRTPTFRSRTRLPPPTGAHITSALGAPLIVVRNKRNADPDDLAVAEARGDQIYATPVTYYTTFTYFTTYLKPDGRTSVASNLQVISSVHYPTQRIAPTRTIFHDQIHRTEPVRAYPSYQGVTGCIRCRSDIKTAYVTHTDYITEFFQGRPVTSTRYVTLTNYVTVTPGQTVYEHRPSQVIAVPGCIHCRQQPQYTTHTYYSTVLVAGRPVTSTRYDTVTNYVTVTVTEEPIHQRTRPTVVQPVVPHQPATAVDTFYTTYTYFTTSVIHGKPTVSTRYETLTNYVTRTRDDGVAGRAIQPTGAYRPVIIRPTPVRDTVYTTYTYFTTRLIHGRPTVETRYETVTDYVTVTVTEQARIRPTQVYRPLYSTVPGYAPHHTAYTTYTFYTTHYLDGRPVVDTRYETVTNVATVTLTEYATPAVGARVRPAETGPYRTYHTTYTYFTTRYVDGSAIVNTRKETVTNTVLGALCRTCPAGYVEGRSHDGGPHQQTAAITHTLAPGPQIQPTPTTYYTTYTHFTTILEGGRPVVQTRYETYTDIVSGIVLPTRALVAPEPSKQDLQQGHIQSRLDHVQDRVQEQLPVFQKIEPSRRRRSSLATRVPFAITDRGLAQAEYELVGGRGDTLSQVPRHRAQRGLSDDVNAPQARPGRKMLSHGRFPRSPLRDGTTTTFAHLRHNANSQKGSRLPPQRFLPKSSASSVFLSDTQLYQHPQTRPEQALSEPAVYLKPSVYYREARRNEKDYEGLRRTARLEPSFLATPSPLTFYTTFSHFTTVLSDGKPSVSTRLEVITNVFTDVVLPTRTTTEVPARKRIRDANKAETNTVAGEDSVELSQNRRPQARKLLSLSSKDNEFSLPDQFVVTDEEAASANRHKPGLVARSAGNEGSPSDKAKDHPVGLIQSAEARAVRNGATTVYATEVYGTFINGAYAQVVSTAVRVFSDQNQQSASHLPPRQERSTSPGSPAQTRPTGLISSIANTVIHDSTTTAYTTNIYGTYIRGMYAHVAQTTSTVIKPQASKSASSITKNQEYKTGLISSLVNTEIHDATTTVWKTHVYGTFVNGFYAHVASTASEVLKPTKNTFVQATSTQIPTRTSVPSQQTKTKSYTTGLLSARTNTVVNGGTSTEVVTNIYGTFVGDLYAQVARTTSRVLTGAAPSTRASDAATPTTAAKLTGIISSTVQSVTHGGVVTYYTTEIHGTSVGGLYAQIAKTSTRTETIKPTSTKAASQPFLQKTGLLSSSVFSSEIHGGSTTLHVSEVYGTYIGDAYAQYGRSTRRIITPTQTSKESEKTESQKTGLVSSIVSTEVQNGRTTLHTTEIHGTYINGFYAHIARKTSSVLQPALVKATQAPAVIANTETLISSEVSTEIRNGATTLHTTNVYGTYINGFYAHVARSTSSIIPRTIAPSSTTEALKTGLVSRSVRSDVHDGYVTEYTTDIYGTFINGFYAHLARTTTTKYAQSTTSKSESVNLLSSFYSSLSALIPSSTLTLTLSEHSRWSLLSSSPVSSPNWEATTIIAQEPSIITLQSPNVHRTTDSSEDYTITLSPSASVEAISTLHLPISSSSKNSVNIVELDTTTDNILEEIGLTTAIRIDSSLDDKTIVPTIDEVVLYSSISTEETKSTVAESTPAIAQIPDSKSIEIHTFVETSVSTESSHTNEILEKQSTEVQETVTSRIRPIFPTRRRPNGIKRPNHRAPGDFRDEEEEPEDYGRNEFLDEEDEDYNEYEEKQLQTPEPRSSKRHRPTRAGYTRGPRQPQTAHQLKHQAEDEEYDLYHDDDYEQVSARSKSQASRNEDSKQASPPSGVNIRPFRRERVPFAPPSRVVNKPSFTLQIRRPHGRQRTNRRRPLKEEKPEEEEIEAEEAVHSSAATPQLHLGRRRGSARPLGAKSPPARAPFTRTRPSAVENTYGISPNRAKSEEEYSDYEEDDDYKAERNPRGRGRLKPPSRGSPNVRGRGNLGVRPLVRPQQHTDEEDSNEDTHSNARNRGRQNPIAKGRRNQNRARAPNLKSSFNTVKDEEESPNLPFARLRGNRRRSSYNPRARRTSLTSTGRPSTKPPITVTSVITTVKTLPIYHGFKTSYATLTTTALASSVIQATLYSTAVDESGRTKTILNSRSDANGPYTTFTEVLITTSDLQQFRLLPIKIGFSTRTDTITETTVLTQLTTLYSTITPEVIPTTPATNPPGFPVPFYPQIPNQDFSLLTSSYVTTETIVTSTVLPIVLRGRTVLSTVTTTKFSESTVTKTASVPVPHIQTAAPFIPQPYFAVPQLTTMLTLYVTGDQGDVIPVVTTVTVPFYQQPQHFFHTKVARSVPDKASEFATLASTAFIGVAVDGSRQDEVPGGDRSEEVALFSSGIEPSLGRASSWSLAQSRSPHSAASESISDADEVTTISMGPITEVYEQLATDIPVLPKPTKGGSAKKWKAEKKPTAAPDVSPEDKYGIGRKFVSRKLQQFEETEDEGVRPAADFTRIRGRSRVRATRVQPLHLSTPEALVDNSGAHQPGFDNAGAVQDVPAEGVARTGVRRGRVFRRPVHRNRAILDDSSPNEFRGPHGGFIRRRPPHIVQDPVDLNPPQEPSSAFHFGDDHQAYSPGNLLETPLPALSSHHILPSPSLDNFLSSSFVGGGYSFSAPEVVATLTDPLASPPNHEITADAVALSGLETSALPQGRVRRIKVLRPAPHGEGSLGDGSKKVRRVTVTRTFSPAGAPTRYEDYRPQVDTPFNQDDGGFNHFGPHQNVVPVVQQQQRQQPQDVLRVPAEVTQQAGLGHGVPYDHFETGVNQQSFPGFSPNVPYQYSPPVPQQFAQAEPYSPRAPEQHDRFTQLQPVQNFVPVAEQPPGPPPAHDFNNVPLEVPVPPPPPPPQPEPVSPTRNSRRTVFRRIRPTNSNHHGERKTSLVRKTRPVVSTPAVQLSSFNIEPTHVFVSADSIDFNRVLGSSQQSLEYFGPASQEYFAPVSQEYFAPVSKEVFAPVSQQYFAPASDQYLSPVSRFPEPPPSLPPVSTEPTFDPHSAAPVEQNRENSADLVEDTTPASHQFRRIIRVKKPGEGKSGQRRKVVLNRRPSINSLQARGPINNGNNANELVPLSVAAPPPLSSQVLSPGQNIVSPRVSLEIGATVPLTYYTTFTYLTTFLHGTDTVYNSREAVLSSVATETLDSNIVNVIQNHGGFTTAPDGVSTVHLGSRTKGAATTIVNLESRLQIFNSDIYKEIHPTPIAQTETTFKTESPVLERIQEPQSPQHNAPGGEDTSTVQLTDLFTAPRTFYTLYTYYYTLFDGAETKNSVRSEISSSVAYDNSPFRPPIAQTKIRNGLLPLGLDVTTVHLGSRNVDGTTTEVNLGMRTVIKFDKIVDADIGQIPENVAPTASYYPSFATEAVDNKIDFISNQERSSLLADALQPSYAIASGDIQPTSNIHATPVILFPVDESTNAPRAKVRIVTSRVKSAGSLKSGVFQAAPGVRVRIKPVVKHLEDSAAYSAPPELSSTRAYEPFSSFFITSPNPSTELTGDEPLLSSAIFPLTTPEDQEVHRGKKRLKVTLRRPIPGDKLARTNSLNTRFVRPSRFEITTKPRFYVVTRTNAAGVARPTKNPFNVKVSKRLKPTDLIRATPSVIYETFTTTTSVPVIFGLQTSYKEVVITASTPVTLTASPTYGVDDHDLIEPSQTVMLTYFTTTTFTVPYTLGDQTLYTTVLETNSRVVTETVAASRVVNALHASHFPEIIGDQNAQLIGRGAAPKHESSLNLLASHYQQRPGLSTRVSDGVTLIVASGGDGEATTHLFPHQPTPYTLQPTLLLDAVLMKEHFDGHNVSPQPYSVSYSTKTLFTTYTYFTTFFTDDSSSIASSEQVISNTVTIPVTQNLYPTITPYLPEPREPSTYLETSERVVTSTSYNTFTFYATLFNGSSSVVTPFEEVQSQVFVITESFTITRTVQPTLSIQPQSTPVFSRPEPQQSYYYPDQDQYLSQHYSSQQPQLYQANDILKSQQLQPSTVLSTLYSTQTNFITFFQGTSTIVTSIEEVLSDVVTITIPHGLATPVLSSPHSPSPTTSVPEFSTRTYLTTQTQYVTFFRGTETILSSIEEIGTTVVTERAGSRPSVYSRPISTPALHSFAPAASSTPSFVLPSHTGAQADLVPSVRTYYTTYTYFTTFYTDSSSIIASRENVVTSHVTLFVPRGSLTSSVRTTAPTRIPTVATHTTSSTSASTRPTTTSTSRYTRPTSTTPPYDTKLYTTGTTYTTYTFYTTLFGGQDKIVISSEQVVPQIVTTRIGSKPSTTSSRYRLTPTVLTHMTTYTYFTTLVSDSETIVSSSEEVITQFVSTTISPSSSTSFVPEVNIITSSLYKPVKEEKVEPSSKTGTSHSKRPSLGSGFKRPSTGFHQKSSVTLFASSSFIPSSSPTLTTVTPAFTILESPSIEEESTRSSMGVSTTVIDGSTVIFFTDIAASQEEETDSIGSDSVSSLFTSSMLSPVFVPSSSLFPEILESSFFSSPSVAAPVTSTTVLESSSKYVGHDNETTTLPPSITLFMVTGTDGSLTRLTEATFTSRTQNVVPSKAAGPAVADIVATEIPYLEQAPSASSPSSGAGGSQVGTSSPSKPIKPGSIIDLADVLGGNANIGGNIGEAIKGIVHLLSNGKKNGTDGTSELQPSQVKEDVPLPPSDGVTVSNIEEPVYIPVGAIASDMPAAERSQVHSESFDGPALTSILHGKPSIMGEGFHTDVFTGAETVFILPTDSHYDDDAADGEDVPERVDKDTSVHLVGSVKKASLPSTDATPALDANTGVITGDKTIFFDDFDKFTELTQRAEDSKGDATISDPKELSKVVGVQTIFFPDTNVLQSSLASEVQITGATTIFGEGFTPILPGTQDSSETLVSSIQPTVVGGAKSVSGATTIFFQLDGERVPILPSVSTSLSTVTQYVTSVESFTRTLTLTTTKVYYTRDSPLTITSVFTTTIAPRTFVSTIIGSRTILGTLPEPSASVEAQLTTPLPSEATTTVTTTTLIFNSITTTVVRTLVLPTERPEPTRSSSIGNLPTTSVLVTPEVRGRTPESADSKSPPTLRPPQRRLTTPRTTTAAHGKRPVIAFRAPSRTPDTASTKPMPTGPKFKIPFPKPPTTTTTTPKPSRPPKSKPGKVTPIDGYPPVCLPGCNTANYEVCRETLDGTWQCTCKPGYGRQDGNKTCTEVETYVVILRVVKMGESAVSYSTELSNSLSTEFQQIADAAKKGMSDAYKKTDVESQFVTSNLNSISAADDLDTADSAPQGILLNFTVSMARSEAITSEVIREQLTRSLRQSNYSIGKSPLFVSPNVHAVAAVQDYDECGDFDANDCDRFSVCVNLPGTYTCYCKSGFEDLDPLRPGRVCSGEIKNCDHCNGRGTCLVNDDGKRSCRCNRMFLGRRCEINGLVLAIALPIALALLVMMLCCLVCLCRRWKRRAQRAKGPFRLGAVSPLGGTLDKKAMITDTSSESSGEHALKHSYAFDGFMVGPGPGKPQSSGAIDTLGRDQVDMGTMQSKLLYVLDGSTGNARQPTDSKSDEGRFASLPDTNTFNRWKSSQTKEESAGAKKKGSKKSSPASSEKKASPPATGTAQRRPDAPAPPPPPPPAPITPGTSRWLDSSKRAAERQHLVHQKQQQQQRGHSGDDAPSQPSTFSREMDKFRSSVAGPSDAGPQQPQQQQQQQGEDAYGTNTFTKKSTISETGRSYDETTIRPAVKRLRPPDAPDDDAVPSTSRGGGGADFGEENSRFDDSGNDVAPSASPIQVVRADASRTRRTSKSGSSTGDSDVVARPF
ncbi:mucin-3B-like isoform X1 [Dermacentor albipictus]|uniref:mucin-3B-like isoform X1 n=1 Tax=Dermacentor albipictus TaxID=60249 RepID=UPI0031FD6AA5